MSDVAFAQGVLRGYVADRPGDNLKHRMASAANALGWTASRVKAVFYGEARVIKANEMEQLRKAAKVERRIEELANEREELSERLERMEAMLAHLLASVEGVKASGARSSLRAKGDVVGARAASRNP